MRNTYTVLTFEDWLLIEDLFFCTEIYSGKPGKDLFEVVDIFMTANKIWKSVLDYEPMVYNLMAGCYQWLKTHIQTK